MLFNVAFIFCLFVITPVGATGKGKAVSTEIRIPEPGEIVKVRSGSLGHYYTEADLQKYLKNYDKNSYLLAVIVSRTGTSKDGLENVVPVIPKDAPPNFFPLHLRGNVANYFDKTNPTITGFENPHVLEGDFNISGSQPVNRVDLKFSNSPTIMSDFDLKKLIEELNENKKNEGMCPIPIEYADLEGENAQRQKGEGRNRFGIEPGQVVYFRMGELGSPGLPGVAVCWTGQGRMALITIHTKKSNILTQKKTFRLGFFDLTQFQFRYYADLHDPRSAMFLKEDIFKKLVNEIVENMKGAKKMAIEGQAAGSSSGGQSGDSRSGLKYQPPNAGSNNKGMNAPTWRGNKDRSGVQSSGADPRVPKWKSSPNWRPDN